MARDLRYETSPFCCRCACVAGARLSAPPLPAQDETRSVQEELRRRSLYFGNVDGRDSAELQEATRRYQSRKGFAATGRPDRETLRSLGLVPRSPNEPPPSELNWPAEPVLPSDEKNRYRSRSRNRSARKQAFRPASVVSKKEAQRRGLTLEATRSCNRRRRLRTGHRARR